MLVKRCWRSLNLEHDRVAKLEKRRAEEMVRHIKEMVGCVNTGERGLTVEELMHTESSSRH
jgi:hypothetical protein